MPCLGARAFAIALVLGNVTVVFPRPLLQSASEELAIGEHSILEHEEHFDETSFLQVSGLVNVRPFDMQQIHVVGAVKENPAAELWAKFRSHAANAVGTESLAVMQSARELVNRASMMRKILTCIGFVFFAIFGMTLLFVLLSSFVEVPDSTRSVRRQRQIPGSYNETMKASLISSRNFAQAYPSNTGRAQAASSLSTGASLMLASNVAIRDPASKLPNASSASTPLTSPLQNFARLTDPEFGAIVPANKKFIAKMPSLIESLPPNIETIKKYGVHSKEDNLGIFDLKVLQLKSEEYLALCVMSDPDQEELAVCTFHPNHNALKCEIYRSGPTTGSQLYGVLQQEAESSSSCMEALRQSKFVLWSASRQPAKLLTVMVMGKLPERRITVFDGQQPSVELGTTVPASCADAAYEAVCFPRSDVTLVILVLAALDRFAVISGKLGVPSTI